MGRVLSFLVMLFAVVLVDRAEAAGSPTRESFPVVAPAAVAARSAEFERRNPGWKVSAFAQGHPFVTADVRSAERTARGPTKRPSSAESLAKARGFLIKNADLVGFTGSELAKAPARVAAVDHRLYPSAKDHAYWITFDGDATQPGFEAFPAAARRAAFHVRVMDDGEVGSFNATGIVDVPKLHVRTTATLTPGDPRVTARVLGQPLYRYTVIGAVPGTYFNVYRRDPSGVVAAADIRNVALTLDVEYRPSGGKTYALACEVSVEKNGESHTFLVDPDTGAVLRTPPPPPGRVAP